MKSSNEEKMGEATERRGSLVKNAKCCLRGTCESPVGLTMCDDPMETFFIKRWVPLER